MGEGTGIRVYFECIVSCGTETGTLRFYGYLSDIEFDFLKQERRFIRDGVVFSVECMDLDVGEGVRVYLKSAPLKFTELNRICRGEYNGTFELNESNPDE